MTVAAQSVCYPPASTSVCPVTDRPKGNDRVYEAGGISVRRTRAMQRRRICAAKRSAAIQIADLTSRMVDGYPERITPQCRERPLSLSRPPQHSALQSPLPQRLRPPAEVAAAMGVGMEADMEVDMEVDMAAAMEVDMAADTEVMLASVAAAAVGV